MNIMTALFDQDEVTRALVASKEKRAEKRANLNALIQIMLEFKVSLSDAMNALKIPEADRDYYIKEMEAKTDKT